MVINPYEGLVSPFSGMNEQRRKRRKHSAGVAGGWQFAGSLIDLDFANGRYFGGSIADLLSCSRASNGYVTNSDGTLTSVPPDTLRIGGIGIGTRTNLWPSSDSFGASIPPITITNNFGSAPDGSAKASRFQGDSDKGCLQNITLSPGAVYTFSIYARRTPSTGAGNLRLHIFESPAFSIHRSQDFTLSFDWQRFSWTLPAIDVASNGVQARITCGADGTDMEIWGAQFELGTVATDYIRTNGSPTTPPLFGIGGTGLLVEEARTNLFLQSGDISNAAWGTRTSILSMTGNAAVTPDGTTTATLVIPDNVNFRHRFRQIVSVLNNTFYSTSIFVKAAGYSKFGMRCSGITGEWATFDLQTGTVIGMSTGGNIQQLTNGWYRCTMIQQEVFGAGSELFDFYVMDSGYVSGTPDNYNYVGDQTSGMYFWGGQNEVGSFSTSYIPTTTVAVTRAADNINGLLGLLTTLDATVGSVRIGMQNYLHQNNDSAALGGGGNRQLIGSNSFGTTTLAEYNGSTNLVATLGSGNTTTQVTNVALSWDGSGRSMVANNGAVATDGAAVGTPTGAVYIGSYSSASSKQMDGYIQRLTVWNSRLSDVALKALTT
jgi:hypothetical protein